jgi:hypothetical protein
VRRLFWALLGLGLGAVVGIQVARWANRTKQRYAPPNLAREAAGKWNGWKSRLRDAIEDGLTEMVAREAEIRSELGVPPASER